MKVVLAIIAAVMLVGGGYAYSSIGTIGSTMNQAGGLNLGEQQDGATDILLVGIDSRTDAHGNPLPQKDIDMLRAGEEDTTSTDTIILIRVPNDGSSATAVSVPRDTYVDAGSDLGNQKINAVYGQTKFYETQDLTQEAVDAGEEPDEREIERESSQAGREALIDTVADVTGIQVDHYAEVGLMGFVNLTDAVGGVDVCLNNAVDEPMSGAKFPAGRQTLDGPDALSFVRQRHELPRGDLDRITRQQVYMASLANKVLSTSTLASPSSLSDLRSAIEDSVVLDEGWDVMGLASQMQNLAGGNVTFQTIPVTSIDGTGDDGSSVVTIDKNQVHDFFTDLLGEDVDADDEDGSEDTESEEIEDYDPAESVVSVYNAGQIGGLASRVGDLVAGAGYSMGEVGNAQETGISESQVNVADTSDPAARGLARQLGGLDVVEDSTLGAGEINVTLSGTYDGPGTSETGVDEPLPAVDEASDSGSSDGSGDSGNVGTPGTDATGGDVLGGSADVVEDSEDADDSVGTQGTPEEDTSSATSSSEEQENIDAGGDGPMCVN